VLLWLLLVVEEKERGPAMNSTERRCAATTGSSPEPVTVALTSRVHIDLLLICATLCRR
jgi:hypothetical protein